MCNYHRRFTPSNTSSHFRAFKPYTINVLNGKVSCYSMLIKCFGHTFKKTYQNAWISFAEPATPCNEIYIMNTRSPDHVQFKCKKDYEKFAKYLQKHKVPYKMSCILFKIF